MIPLLHRIGRVTFFTHDEDYFHADLVHGSYCLVYLDVYDGTAADYIRQFLRHPAFKTLAKRLGKVVRLHPAGASFYQRSLAALQHENWV